MTSAAVKIIAAFLLSGMGITAGPVPIPNHLDQNSDYLYPDLGLTYPGQSSVFLQRNTYPHLDPNPYPGESDALLPAVAGPLAADDPFPVGDPTADRLALTDLERRQLLGILADDLAPEVEYPSSYDLVQSVDPDWYETLGLAPPYWHEDEDEESGEGENEDEDEDDDESEELRNYLEDTSLWPLMQKSIVRSGAGQDRVMLKKSAQHLSSNLDRKTGNKPAKHPSSAGSNADDTLVKQIDGLKAAAGSDDSESTATEPFPRQARPTTPPSAPVVAGLPSAPAETAQVTEDDRSENKEALLVDQLRAAASAPQTAPHDTETTYEAIKRFLVMKDALKRMSRSSTKKTKRFVSDRFTKQLEDLKTVKT